MITYREMFWVYRGIYGYGEMVGVNKIDLQRGHVWKNHNI